MSSNKAKSHQPRVGVIVGGTPEELNDSICTAHEIAKAIENSGKHVEIITFDDKFEKAIKYAQIDIAFIVDATYIGKTKPKNGLRNMLGRLGIPYTGSQERAASITKNKSLSKKYFTKAGLLTPTYIVLNNENLSKLKKFLVKLDIKSPYVIKPRDEGAGLDVSFVETLDNLNKTARNLLKRHKNLMVEHYIDGTEITIPVLEIKGKPIPLTVVEIEKKVKVLSNDVKSLIQFSPQKESEKTIKYILPARINKKIYEKVLQGATIAHKVIGCKGYSRVDMIVDKSGKIFLLEINSLPTLSEHGLFSKAGKLRNITYEDVLSNIIQNALNSNTKSYGKYI